MDGRLRSILRVFTTNRMKLIAALVITGFAASFDIDIDHGETLKRSKRDSDPQPCCFDFFGNEFCYQEYSLGTEKCSQQIDADYLDSFYFECDDDEAYWNASESELNECAEQKYLQYKLTPRSSGPQRKLGVRYTRWKVVTKMIAHIVAKPSLSKKQVIKKILNYGCHCFPGQKKFRSVGGKGPAMDELDSLCRAQYQCHKCVQMDTGCDPDNTPYTIQFKGKKAMVKDVICKDEVGTCGRTMCDCDRNMANNLEKVWFNAGLHNSFYWGDKKNKKRNPYFDYEGTCVNTGMSAQPDACCGTFPDVLPYNQASKDCCITHEGPKLFDFVTHTCCSGGVIATAGSC